MLRRWLTRSELEYLLLPFAWRRGIATEAAAAARDDAFGRGGVSELLGRFGIENARSRRVLEELGFSFINGTCSLTAWSST